MRTSTLHYLFGIVITILCLSAIPLQSQAADAPIKSSKATQSDKERLVLMPLRVDEEDKNLFGAMETALVEGLRLKYVVFSGERVAQKAHEIFMKESRNTAHKECDETRCMQNIAEAFQAELIATANVTKQGGGYFLALSIQNIFDNKVEFSKTMTCEGCNAFKVVDKLKILSGVVASNADDTTNEETQADRKLKAAQLKKEQQEFEDKLSNADAAERKRLLDAKAADDKHLAELKAAAEARRKNNQTPPTTIPTLELAQTEVKKLNDRIAVIEAGYEKELADTRKQINQRYTEKLDALKRELRGEFDSKDEFNAKQEIKRNELISQREAELARLNVPTVAETETAPLKTRIKSLTDHEYVVGADSIEAELGAYDSDDHEFPIKLHSKSAAFSLKLKSAIPMQSKDAEVFKKQWQSGLVRPEAKVKINGEVVELSLVNDSEISSISNTQLFEFKESQWSGAKSVFYTRAKAAELADAEMRRPGRKFKDCDECPTMVVLPPVNGVPIAEASSSLSGSEWRYAMGKEPWGDMCFGFAPSCPGHIPRYYVDEFIKKLNAKTGKNYFLQLKDLGKLDQDVLDNPNRYPAGMGNGIGYTAGIIIARTLP